MISLKKNPILYLLLVGVIISLAINSYSNFETADAVNDFDKSVKKDLPKFEKIGNDFNEHFSVFTDSILDKSDDFNNSIEDVRIVVKQTKKSFIKSLYGIEQSIDSTNQSIEEIGPRLGDIENTMEKGNETNAKKMVDLTKEVKMLGKKIP